jgi:uncharacterized damage-inducible protein DinB
MHSFLRDLFEYNEWANAACRVVLQIPGAPKKSLELFGHILNAHGIWLDRIQGRIPDHGPWQPVPVDLFKPTDQTQHQQTFDILRERDPSTLISYQNTKGRSFENTIQDILIHVVNHGTYHRGQIAALLASAGVNPPVTDFIAYKRT